MARPWSCRTQPSGATSRRPDDGIAHQNKLNLEPPRNESGDADRWLPVAGDEVVDEAAEAGDDLGVEALGRREHLVGAGGLLAGRIERGVDGTTGDGEPFTVVRTNRYANTFDITFDTIWEVGDAVWALSENDLTDVDIDSV